jgi:hypothetical protein
MSTSIEWERGDLVIVEMNDGQATRLKAIVIYGGEHDQTVCLERFYDHPDGGSSWPNPDYWKVSGGDVRISPTEISQILGVDPLTDKVFWTIAPHQSKIVGAVSKYSLTLVSTHTGGMQCARCREFNSYAQPNQKNGTFLCYGCRS